MTVRNSLVSERVFATLLEAILAGRYEPGERLPGQRALARDLGVTLSSLREALKRLEQMGLVDVRHGDAMRVRAWREHASLDVLAHALLAGGAADRRILGDLLDARAGMARELAMLAARRAGDGDAAELTALAAQLGERTDPERAALLDFAFFTELARLADNVVFDLILNAIRGAYLADTAAVPVTARPAELSAFYGRVARAVARGDEAGAGRAAFDLAQAQAAMVRERWS